MKIDANTTTLQKRIFKKLILYSTIIIVVPLLIAEYFTEWYEQHRLNQFAEREYKTLLVTEKLDQATYQAKNKKIKYFIRNQSDKNATHIHPVIANLAPGLHSDVEIEGREYFVLVRDHGAKRIFMRYNITDLDSPEREVLVLGIIFYSIVFLTIFFMSRRLSKLFTQPVVALSQQITALNAEERGQRLQYSAVEMELQGIADVFNQYLIKLDQYVDREMEFLETASHELRTPVTIIKGAIDILNSLPEVQRLKLPTLARIDDAATNMLKMVEVLLFLAKDPNHIAELVEPVEVNLEIQNSLDAAQFITERKDLVFKINLDNTCILAPLFLTRIVLSNLINNAIYHTTEGEVVIELFKGVLRMSNQGNTAKPEHTIALFQKKVRGDGTSYKQGNGLGLYIIRKICDQLSWNISLTTNSNSGTELILDCQKNLI